jgi:hypothetical protein
VNLVIKILTGALAAALAGAMTKAASGSWRKVTGAEPPAADDPEASTRQAVLWAAISGLTVAIAQVLATRVSVRAKKALG